MPAEGSFCAPCLEKLARGVSQPGMSARLGKGGVVYATRL
jgi:hypothetical protein